jgi:hypothetical protein
MYEGLLSGDLAIFEASSLAGVATLLKAIREHEDEIREAWAAHFG